MSTKKTFLRYVSANIMGMIGLSCYILADTFFVAKGMGANGLTALNLAIPIYSFIHATGLMIGIGGAARYSICKAKNENAKADIVFTNSIRIGIVMGILFLLTGLFGSEVITRLLGSDKSTFAMTNEYLKTILCFAPFFILNNIYLAFVRNDGNPKLPMAGMLIGSFSNVVLDYIFIFPLQWGMFGAAFATGLAPVISIGILSIHGIKKKNQFHFHKSAFRISQIANVCSLGISSFIAEIASGIILIVFNLLILRIAGNLGVAAYGIVANLALVAVSIYTGIAQGTQPLFSKSFGRGNQKEISGIFNLGIITSLIISVLLYLLIAVLKTPLVGVFNSENIEMLSKIASGGLVIYFTGFFFAGINIIVASMLSSINEPKAAFIISILRSGGIIIPLALILANLAGMTGVWMSFPLSELITSLLAWRFARKALKNLVEQS